MLATQRRYDSVAERVLANSVVNEEHRWGGTACWDWLGPTRVNCRGEHYPSMSVRVDGKVKQVQVTRVILEEVKGLRITKVHVAAHECNRSICVNFDHIRRDTQSGNMEQCIADGRHNSQREPGED